MAANAANPSPLARSSQALFEPSTAITWASTLDLQLNVLNDHPTSIAPEIYKGNTLPSASILPSAARTAAGCAAIDSAISALASFATLHAKLSSPPAPAPEKAVPSPSVAAETPHAFPNLRTANANNNLNVRLP